MHEQKTATVALSVEKFTNIEVAVILTGDNAQSFGEIGYFIGRSLVASAVGQLKPFVEL